VAAATAVGTVGLDVDADFVTAGFLRIAGVAGAEWFRVAAADLGTLSGARVGLSGIAALAFDAAVCSSGAAVAATAAVVEVVAQRADAVAAVGVFRADVTAAPTVVDVRLNVDTSAAAAARAGRAGVAAFAAVLTIALEVNTFITA
jgi:hypothetical protein